MLGYAGRQVESAETQAEAETLQRENDNGSIKHKYSHRSFSEQVDDLKKGNIPSGDSLFVCATPKVFQDIGFSYLPMTIDQYHANAAIKGTKPNHFIPEKIFKTLPEQLQKPVAIIESESRTEDSVIVVLDKELKTGQWMAAIEIEGTRHLNGQEYKVVPINNTQGRKNTISKLLRNALKNEIENGHGVYYINEKRARQLTEDEGVQFPDNIPPNGLMHSIAKPNESVNKKSSFRASAQDAEYMRAVEEDDEFTQEEMVIEAAKKAGYNYVRYTRRKLNPRNNGADYYMFVEADKEGKVAQVYGDNRYFATDRTAVDINDIEDEIKEAWREFAEENDYPENSLELTDEGFPDDIVDSAGIFDNQDFMAYLYEHALLDRFGDETPVIRTADGLVVFGDDYGIIKSGDPITYDDNGDIIPLSE